MKEADERLRLLAEMDLASLTEGEIAELAVDSHRLVSMATAVHTRTVAALDRSRAWEAEGARSAAAWVAWRCRIPAGRARAILRCGRELRSMPEVEAAFLDGRLTADHVRALAVACAANATSFAECEADLVKLAETLLFRSFEVAIRYWCRLHDPDGCEDEARDRYRSRHAHCSTTFEGTVVLDALLDPIGGEIVRREIERLEQEMFEADWADARERCGGGASVLDLERTPAQRRADALVEMATRSASLTEASRARPLLSVLVGDQTLERICELSSGTVVTPGEVLPLLRDIDVERVVFDGRSRVLDVGVRQRLFTGATRRAVEVRDRQCSHPSCTIPAERCQVDHLHPYDEGGLTIQANGECKCTFHHRWRHRSQGPDTSAIR